MTEARRRELGRELFPNPQLRSMLADMTRPLWDKYETPSSQRYYCRMCDDFHRVDSEIGMEHRG